MTRVLARLQEGSASDEHRAFVHKLAQAKAKGKT